MNSGYRTRTAPAIAVLTAVCLLVPALSSCVSTPSKRLKAVPAQHAEHEIADAKLMNVNIAVFDPGLPNNARASANPTLFPEVRKAEARYMPVNLRDTLQNTGYWGAVRVVPEPIAYSELLVTGMILHSTGLALVLGVHAVDASGRVWLDKTYSAEASKLSYKGKQAPFQSVYNRIANDLLQVRRKLVSVDLRNIRHISAMRFAANLAPQAFNRYVSKDGKRYRLHGLPAANDPLLGRVNRIRKRDYALIDALDRHYRVFHQQLKKTYDDYRSSNYTQARQLRKLHKQSLTREILGAAAVLGGIFGLTQATTAIGGLASEAGIIGGAAVIGSGISKAKEAEIYAERLKQLGRSLESEVKPRVVKLKGQTVTLSGSAREQYDQWRKLLKNIYAQETGFAADTSATQKTTGPEN